MDFDEAAISHLQWKDTLLNHLAKRDERLDPFELSLDDRCALGQWIQGEGARYSSDPAYISLKTQHTRFHKAVGEVVRGASLGLKIRVEKVLGTDSEFGEASVAVITALVNLKREVAIPTRSMAAVAGGGEDNATAVIVSPASSMDTRYPGWDPSYSVGVADSMNSISISFACSTFCWNQPARAGSVPPWGWCWLNWRTIPRTTSKRKKP